MKRKSHLLRLMKLVWLVSCICPQARGEEVDIGRLLDQAIEREVAKLQPNSLTLPVPVTELNPPPLIQDAGKDFVSAWRVWATVMAPRTEDKPATLPEDRKRLVNVDESWEPFHDLLKRSIEADPPPELAEFPQFTLTSLSWYGSADGFRVIYAKGVGLTLLRQKKMHQALKMEGLKESARDSILMAFGVDPEEFRIGGWLNEAGYPAALCEDGGERTARMLMDWMDFRWEVELARRKKSAVTHSYGLYKEPVFPGAAVLQLLRKDNGVTEETKVRIAKFIETRSLEMFPMQTWFYVYPKGAERWLVPIGWRGLTHDLNEIRNRSSRLLTAAGVEHPKPEMRPDLRFSVLINARIWPGEFGHPGVRPSGLPLSVHADNSSWSTYLLPDGPGSFRVDFDSLMRYGSNLKAEIRQRPILFGEKWAKPTDMWLRAKVPLPIDLFHVNQIEMETYDFSIRPKFPERIGAAEEEVYEVDFDMADGGKDQKPPREGHCRLLVKGRQPLVLSTVSPGDYWLQIRHAGAALMPRQKVTVSWWRRSVEPRLETGSTLVVPVEWPEVKEPEKLPPELAPSFGGFRPDWHDSLHSVIRLKRKDGSVVEDFGKLPIAAKGRFPMSVIFPYLPPGEYEVESPERTIEPAGTNSGCVIRKTSLKVEIRKDSPVFVVTNPLKIDYIRKD